MFRGVSTINIDAKGRLAIPAKYRPEILDICDSQMIVAYGLTDDYAPQNGCLWLYPLPEWEALEEKLMHAARRNKVIAGIQRFFVGTSSQCDLDAQGRVLIPDAMKQKIGLDKKIALVGHGKRFEVWSEDIWSTMQDTWFDGIEVSEEGREELDAIQF